MHNNNHLINFQWQYPYEKDHTSISTKTPNSSALINKIISKRSNSNKIKHLLCWRNHWLFFVFFFLLIAAPGFAQQQNINLDDIADGQLLFKNGKEYVGAMQLDTQVDIEVSGIIADVAVKQKFLNLNQYWAEAVYAFPLPEDAAVYGLTVIIGDTIIEGEIQEKQQAIKTYTEAKNAGVTASLVEQHRPNLFSTKLANIAPDEEIVVEIRYWQTIQYDNNQFHLKFPMTVTPRYSPQDQQLTQLVHEESSNKNITQPAVSSSEKTIDADHLLELNITLNSETRLAKVASVNHDVAIHEYQDHYEIELANLVDRPNRDFELVWSLELNEQPQISIFTEEVAGEWYATLMMVPPRNINKALNPRDVTFIIDTSGSMEGASIVQAKESLKYALQRLNPFDYFNVIEFNSAPDLLFPEPVSMTAENLAMAMEYVDELVADGGTEIRSALEVAINAQRVSENLQQLVFITDGSVSNEVEVLNDIQQQLGDMRLFTVGIGSAPNSYFMRKAAEFGHGTFTYIKKIDQVQTQMLTLLAKLENPALTEMMIDWGDVVDTYPKVIPDLYLGEPIILSAKLMGEPTHINIEGMVNNQVWHYSQVINYNRELSGVAVLWARRKIEALMDSLLTGADPSVVKDEVIATSIEHHLVSAYTSLVAVDKTPARVKQERLAKFKLVNETPFSEVDAYGYPQGGLGINFYLLLGCFSLLLSLLFSAIVNRQGGR